MAARPFYLPFQAAVKPTNVGAPNAKYYFYAAESTTLQSIYSNTGLSVALANPLTADGAGVIPQVYMSDALTWKLVIKDKNGATLYTRDPYIPGVAPDAADLEPYQTAAEGAAAAAAESAASAAANLLALIQAAAGTDLGVYALPVYTPDMYAGSKASGVIGDGTDDGPALHAMGVAASATGGVIWLGFGATYWIGGQALNQPGEGDLGTTPYTFGATTWFSIPIVGATRPVRIMGNGAKIKCLPGKKYGAFNEDGSARADASPFTGVGGVTGENRASAYAAMVQIQDCTAAVTVEDLELDGSKDDFVLGGVWGDTGRQLPGSGIYANNNTGGIRLVNIHSHHHPQDGSMLAGVNGDRSRAKERGIADNCNFEFNGRQGCSFIGGKGWTFNNCAFNYTGRAAAGSDTEASFWSFPGAGVDCEAEVGTIEEIKWNNCEFVGNVGAGLLWAGDAGDVDLGRGVCDSCTFIGTTSYGVYGGRNLTFDNCKFVGTIVWQGGAEGYSQATVTRESASNFIRCSFYDAAVESPTGTTLSSGGTFVENCGFGLMFERCTFVHDRAGFAFPGVTAADANKGPVFQHCEFIVKQGTMSYIGRLYGSAFLREVGTGAFTDFPLGRHNCYPFTSKGIAGYAECYWWYQKADGTYTEYPPSLDGTGCYRGMGAVTDTDFTTVNPPDLPTANTAYGLQGIRFTAAVAAPRTVTLSTTNATLGMRRRFVRESTATGASAVSIGGLKNLAVSTWCEVVYDGAAWKLSAYGAL